MRRRGKFIAQIKIQQNTDSGSQLSKLSRQIPPFVTQPSVYQALLQINFDNSYPIQVPFKGNTIVILLLNDTTFGGRYEPCQFNSGRVITQIWPEWGGWVTEDVPPHAFI